jgi:Zn-dependent protease
MTAFAGPAVNLVLFLATFLLLKSRSFVKNNKKYVPLLFITSRINIFLFIFNMLPIPMFDGWKVYSGLIGAFF